MSYLAGIERVAQNIGHENILINGGFEIWQRGTSFSTPADGAYTADRWQNKGAKAQRRLQPSQRAYALRGQ